MFSFKNENKIRKQNLQSLTSSMHNGKTSYLILFILRFRMNSSSGELSVMGELDREENPTYYLTVEAKDGGGLRTPVEVTVHILDANDNKPVFRRNDYESILREGADDFTRPVIVEVRPAVY